MVIKSSFFAFLFIPILGMSQNTNEMKMMFYNVENLFDTIDAPDVLDEDFTPEGKLNYNSIRYNEKLTNLAKVIDSSYAGTSPNILGLCEVENLFVVRELRDYISIPNNLKIIHVDSPDGRGIDNALLFDSALFELEAFGLEKIDLGAEERPTRGILWVTLKENLRGQTFIFMVNHWPSRYGGQEESEWRRIKASETALALIDSLELVFPRAGMVLMGDFNDYPDNKSIQMLEKCEDENQDACLLNMQKHLIGTDAGSYAYKGEWGILDQFLVNKVIQEGVSGWSIPKEQGNFVKKPWMLYFSERDNDSFPSRTYSGSNYFGGFSDHLPATFRLYLP